jgi:hypothetical protein
VKNPRGLQGTDTGRAALPPESHAGRYSKKALLTIGFPYAIVCAAIALARISGDDEEKPRHDGSALPSTEDTIMYEISLRKAFVVGLTFAMFAATPADNAVAANKTAAQKCQKEIDKAVQKLTKKKLKKLFKCGNKNLKKGLDPAACFDTVSVAVKLSNKVKKKVCTADVITDGPSEDGLGFTTCATRNPSGCTAPTNADTLVSCLQCSHDFETDCLFGAVYNISPAGCLEP